MTFLLAIAQVMAMGSLDGCDNGTTSITEHIPNDLYAKYTELLGKVEICRIDLAALESEVGAYVSGPDIAAKKAEFGARKQDIAGRLAALSPAYDAVMTSRVIYEISELGFQLTILQSSIDAIASAKNDGNSIYLAFINLNNVRGV
ncbi:MAG: hypothetical protein LBI17_02025 [Rickettsiales bacterium]|nr:hypothetical protein [Rickettsiales bacterium]